MAQAANIRPLSVLRELENKSVGGRVMTTILLALFSLLFCLLAIVILNNAVILGIFVTYGAFGFLLILSGFFSLIVFALSKLPVPERFSFAHSALIVLGLAISVLVYLQLPVFGIFLFVVSLLGIVVLFLPRGWKMNIKMALRNLGRRRMRTTATMLALFIGVWGIGVDIGIGQDMRTEILSALNQNSPYNLVATTVGKDANTLHAHLGNIAGVSTSREDPFTESLPVAINGRPAQESLPQGAMRQEDLAMLGGSKAMIWPTQCLHRLSRWDAISMLAMQTRTMCLSARS